MAMLNIAGYKFIPLADLAALQEALMAKGSELALKGTILLSLEGINVSLSGGQDAITHFKDYLKEDLRFQDMSFRESYSDTQPFKHLRVKQKKEIITMGRTEIHAELSRAPAVSPLEFKQWLDDKKAMTVLDTRNDYEVRFGTFHDATHFGLDDFGQFPDCAEAIPRDKPIVMFCTGGVRCEKAALHLLNEGFSNVYQLEGGILNYFAEVGGAHYDGECFVFDQRVALNADLQETGTLQCKQCEGPVKFAERGTQSQEKIICSSCNISTLTI